MVLFRKETQYLKTFLLISDENVFERINEIFPHIKHFSSSKCWFLSGNRLALTGACSTFMSSLPVMMCLMALVFKTYMKVLNLCRCGLGSYFHMLKVKWAAMTFTLFYLTPDGLHLRRFKPYLYCSLLWLLNVSPPLIGVQSWRVLPSAGGRRGPRQGGATDEGRYPSIHHQPVGVDQRPAGG